MPRTAGMWTAWCRRWVAGRLLGLGRAGCSKWSHSGGGTCFPLFPVPCNLSRAFFLAVPLPAVRQAFLDMRQLMGYLEDILRQCRKLCALVQVGLVGVQSLASMGWAEMHERNREHQERVMPSRMCITPCGRARCGAWGERAGTPQPVFSLQQRSSDTRICCGAFSPSSLQRLAAGLVDAVAAAAALQGIRRTFRLKHRVLYQIMQSGKLSSRTPALRQLITRLNFNGFAERQARPVQEPGSAVLPSATAPAASPCGGQA